MKWSQSKIKRKKLHFIPKKIKLEKLLIMHLVLRSREET